MESIGAEEQNRELQRAQKLKKGVGSDTMSSQSVTPQKKK